MIAMGAYSFDYFREYGVEKLNSVVEPNDFISVAGIETKVIDTEINPPRTGSGKSDLASKSRTATVQWRCRVQNKSGQAIRYTLQIQLLDRDGFILASCTYDSNEVSGDLLPRATQSIYQNVLVAYTKINHLSACKVTPLALRTDDEIRSEKEQVREKEILREQAKFRQTQTERQKSLNAELNKWKELEQGMTKDEVESLLGKPRSVEVYGTLRDTWVYPPMEGSYIARKVEFDRTGKVKGWRVP